MSKGTLMSPSDVPDNRPILYFHLFEYAPGRFEGKWMDEEIYDLDHWTFTGERKWIPLYHLKESLERKKKCRVAKHQESS